MKIGNTVPRARIKPISLAFQASVLTITSHKFPGVTTIPRPTCLCSYLPQKSVQATYYIYAYMLEPTQHAWTPLSPLTPLTPPILAFKYLLQYIYEGIYKTYIIYIYTKQFNEMG